MSNSPWDGLSASKSHPTRPLWGRPGRRPRCEHGESLAHTHYVVNTRSRDVVIIDCPKTGYYMSQPLLQEAHEARPQEAAIACRLLDRVVEPVVRRALHDAGAHKEIGLLQFQQERVGLRAAIDEIVLGSDAQEHADLIVGKGRIVDGRGIEIAPRIVHGRGAHEIFDIVLARAR